MLLRKLEDCSDRGVYRMEKMEQKQIQRPVGGNPKKEYQVFELNGEKLDYFDIDLAFLGLSTLILEYQASVRNKPGYKNPRYDGMLHTAEEKFRRIREQMERPPEDEMRPSG